MCEREGVEGKSPRLFYSIKRMHMQCAAGLWPSRGFGSVIRAALTVAAAARHCTDNDTGVQIESY